MLIIIVNGRTNAKSKNTTRLKQSLMRLGVFGGVCSSLVLAEQNKKAHCVQASIEIFNENQLRGVSIEKNWISQTMVQRLGEARQHIVPLSLCTKAGFEVTRTGSTFCRGLPSAGVRAASTLTPARAQARLLSAEDLPLNLLVVVRVAPGPRVSVRRGVSSSWPRRPQPQSAGRCLQARR